MIKSMLKIKYNVVFNKSKYLKSKIFKMMIFLQTNNQISINLLFQLIIFLNLIESLLCSNPNLFKN